MTLAEINEILLTEVAKNNVQLDIIQTNRQHSATACACLGQVGGFAVSSYVLALKALVEYTQ
ncbi:hypothetical protein Amet_2488 [Alkaliphilus metalliredigens QYMF]|uniref:3-dehydroquinate dehydratase n=1 Tax=Alkaliphilus metalliredigens (strain QYMF) TaxID=293826 RepID=A6TR23_ALKMQ|nr:hypothetical protein [Alkaliphilus metalliredigens]ABR48641.1 hypothetical protein Amet_2488 [Alkaliphilus metalliredigens QYMF]